MKPGSKELPLFEGTPSFDAHKVLVGVVTGADDAQGTFDVQVGTALGTVKLADYDRYDPQKLPASVFAPTGAHVRVSLLAPVPLAPTASAPDATDAKQRPASAVTRVPLRLELGPRGGARRHRRAEPAGARARGELRGGDGGARPRHAVAPPAGVDVQANRLLVRDPRAALHAIHAHRRPPGRVRGGLPPCELRGVDGDRPLRLREALANSVNVVAVRVLADVGPANVVEWGHALGIRSVMKPDLSLALGSYEVLPMELCGAYVTFAAGGTYEEPSLITSIVGPDGKDVPLDPPVPPRRVLDPAEAYVTTSLLTSVIDHGTGAAAKRLGRPLAGKTGTSNLSKDTWFAGYSTDLAAVVWVGYDDGKSLGASETGASAALPAWLAFMKEAGEHRPASEFPRPPGVKTVVIDTHTGVLPTPGDPDTMEEVFLDGTEPTTTEVDAGVVLDAGMGAPRRER